MATQQAQRSSNTLKVVTVLRRNASSTVSEIAERTHLSRLTVAKILQRLGEDTIVRREGKAPGSAVGGRKPRLYHFNPSARYGLGILIGATAIAGRLVDLNINTVEHCTLPISQDASADTLLQTIDRLVSTVVERAGIARELLLGIGVGTHGVTDSERGIVLTSPHNPGWGNDLPLRDILRGRLGSTVPIFIDNAIRFRTLAETTAGKLRSVSNAVVIHIGDGLIAGNLLNGSIYRGIHNFAGSVGHMKVNPADTERCDCGGTGCFEMQIKPARVLARARALQAEYPDSTLFGDPTASPSLADLGDAADSGDRLARAAMDETISWFAIALHNLILMFDPDKIVLQGIYAHVGDYFLANLRNKVWEVSLVNIPHRTPIECSTLDDEEAGTIGAASHVIAHAFV